MNDIRRLIRLAEGLEPSIEEAFELIEEYVTYGPIQDTKHVEHFDQSFARIMELIPRPEKAMRLFRVLALSDEQFAAFRAGESVTLKPRAFMSWTKDPEAADKFSWGRSREGSVIIAEMVFQPAEIVIDVVDFYTTHSLFGQPENTYVRAEKEVIVRHPEPLVVSNANAKVFDRGFEDSATIIPPAQYDAVWDDGDTHGDPYEILEVPENQPERDRGVFRVYVSGVGRADVRPIMVDGEQAEGEWMFV